jgi:hypothetical protein
MRKFIKENLLKIVVLLFSLGCIIAGFYFIARQHSLETSIKCSNDGQKFFNSYKAQKTSSGSKFSDEPTYHFNNQLNSCLISISYQDSTHYHYNGSQYEPVYDISYDAVIDIYSNKVLISTNNYNDDKSYQQQKETMLRN